MRKPFQFKQFNIQDEKSALRVGTDAVLLGAYVMPKKSKAILDIGCGSGIIALMMAQKSTSLIDAIDIDFESIQEAKINFGNSPWSKQLIAIHSSISDYVKQSNKKYDLIISNPPFFNNSLKSISDRNNLSKHTLSLSHEELLSGVKNLLMADGEFYVILPFDQMSPFLNTALIAGLFCTQKLIIYPTTKKPANRIILGLRNNHPIKTNEESLSIRDSSGNFTEQYKTLTRDFYINF